MLIVCCFVIRKDVIAKLREVGRMIASKVTASPFGGVLGKLQGPYGLPQL